MKPTMNLTSLKIEDQKKQYIVEIISKIDLEYKNNFLSYDKKLNLVFINHIHDKLIPWYDIIQENCYLIIELEGFNNYLVIYWIDGELTPKYKN